MTHRSGPVLAGTFLISFALLAFEVSSVRTLNFVVGSSYIYHAIALAMLGLSAAGSTFSLLNLRGGSPSRNRVLAWFCLAIAVCLILSHVYVADVKLGMNAAIEAAGREGGWARISTRLVPLSAPAAMKVGAVLLPPYFLFGALLSFLFATTDRASYGRVYAADLIGAALGSICAVLVMEATGYAFSATLPSIVAVLAGAAFAASHSKRFAVAALVLAAGLGAVTTLDAYASRVEPSADPHYQVRDYDFSRDVRELSRGWNSFTRVGAVAVDDYAIMSLGNADGMAWLPSYRADRPRPWRHGATVPALLLDPPEDALVLFAGAGADVISLKEHGVARATGVEMNRMLVDQALALERYGVADLLSDPGARLVVSEARGYLARDRNRYDMVLLSYSGAPVSYFAGMQSAAVQYLFTYEGVKSVLDHLEPDGYAVILQINKVNTLAALRRYLMETPGAPPERTAIVLFDPEGSIRDWKGSWDDNPLLVKPSGWSEAEVERIARNARREGFEIAYAPGRPTHPDYHVYRRMLEVADPQAELAALRASTGLRLEVKTDDRPFTFDLFLNRTYLERNFWRGPWASPRLAPHELFRWVHVVFMVTIIVLALLLVVAPLFLRAGPPRTKETLSHLTYFACLGIGFMVVEIGLMQKTGLLFDTPGWAIAIVLASLILFAGLGSFVSDRRSEGNGAWRRTSLGVVAYSVLLFFLLGPLTHALLPAPLLIRAIAVCAIVAPGALLMGHLFPWGLRAAGESDARLVPWAWGINGAMSTIGAGVAPLVAMGFGYNVLFLGGAALYAVTVILPTTAALGRS